HFEGVTAGNHVVQVDTASIPETMESKLCEDTVAHSGRAYSQFVDVRGGAMWRADFRLAKRTPPQGSVALSMSTTLVDDFELTHSVTIDVVGNAIANTRAIAVLPTGIEFKSNS